MFLFFSSSVHAVLNHIESISAPQKNRSGDTRNHRLTSCSLGSTVTPETTVDDPAPGGWLDASDLPSQSGVPVRLGPAAPRPGQQQRLSGKNKLVKNHSQTYFCPWIPSFFHFFTLDLIVQRVPACSRHGGLADYCMEVPGRKTYRRTKFVTVLTTSLKSMLHRF